MARVTEFMSADQALSISKENKQKRVEYYLDNINKDRKANVIKREIEKTVVRGEKYAHVIFWTRTNSERANAIEKYFKNLGYDISFSGDRCDINLQNRHGFPKAPDIYR